MERRCSVPATVSRLRVQVSRPPHQLTAVSGAAGRGTEPALASSSTGQSRSGHAPATDTEHEVTLMVARHASPGTANLR